MEPFQVYKDANNYKGFYCKIEFFRYTEMENVANEEALNLESARLGGIDDLGKTLGETIGKIEKDGLKETLGLGDIDFKDTSSIKENATSLISNVKGMFVSFLTSVLLKNSTKKDSHFTCILPLPTELPSDSISIEWSEKPMGVLGTLANKSQSYTDNNITDTSGNVIQKKFFDAIYEKTLSKSGDILGGINSLLTNAQDVRASQRGITFGGDDTMVVLEGMKRRNITLDWSFIPFNQTESKNIFAIIDEIKSHSLPSNTSNSFGITYPYYIRVSIMLNNTLFYCIDEGVVEQFDVTFPSANAGIWHSDGTPNEIQMRLAVKERRKMYKEDYGYNEKVKVEPPKENPMSAGLILASSETKPKTSNDTRRPSYYSTIRK